MKRLTVAIIIALVLIGCGSDTSTSVTGDHPVADKITVECFDINTSYGCFSVAELPISSPGYVYIEIANNTAGPVEFFYRIDWQILGCTPPAIESFSDLIKLPVGAVFNHEYAILGWRCAKTGSQSATISLYGVESFDPAKYAGPLDYPRNQLISNSTLNWTFTP